MKSKLMERAVFWLVIFGPLLIGLAACIYYGGGNKSLAVWMGFGGGLLLLLAVTVQLQEDVWKEQADSPPKDNPRRAYVYVTDGDVANPPGGIVTVAVNIKNTGQTPALELTWRAKFEVQLIGNEEKIKLDPDAVGVKQTLPPGESLSYKYSFPTWDPAIDALLASEKAAIFAIGEIRYKDSDGIDRFTDYLLKSGGRFPISTGIGPGKFGAVKIKSN